MQHESLSRPDQGCVPVHTHTRIPEGCRVWVRVLPYLNTPYWSDCLQPPYPKTHENPILVRLCGISYPYPYPIFAAIFGYESGMSFPPKEAYFGRDQAPPHSAENKANMKSTPRRPWTNSPLAMPASLFLTSTPWQPAAPQHQQ